MGVGNGGSSSSNNNNNNNNNNDQGILVVGHSSIKSKGKVERTEDQQAALESGKKKLKNAVKKINASNTFLASSSPATLAQHFEIKEQSSHTQQLALTNNETEEKPPKVSVDDFRLKISSSNFAGLDDLRKNLDISLYTREELEQLDTLFLNRALRLSEAAEKRRKDEQRVAEAKEALEIEANYKKSQEEHQKAAEIVATNSILDSNSFTYDNLYKYHFRTLSKNTQKDLESHFELRSDLFLANTIPLTHFNTFKFNHESLDNIYLIYGKEANGVIHSIKLSEFNSKVLEDKTKDPRFDHALNRRVLLKMHSLGITDYAYATQDEINDLKPPRYMAYGSALLGSTITVSIFNSTAYTAFLGPILGFSLFWLNAHSNLKTLNYQNKKENKGKVPDDDIKDVFNHDARTLCYQNLFATSVSSLILSTPTHEAFKCAAGVAWVLALPVWAHVTISLGLGLVMGSMLMGIAMYRQRNEDQHSKNRYTAKQLGLIFATGFVAGSLIYPALMLSTIAPSIVTKNAGMAVLANTANFAMLFQVLINFGLGIALHKNIGDRLEAPRPAAKKESGGVLSFVWNKDTKKQTSTPTSSLPVLATATGSLHNT